MTRSRNLSSRPDAPGGIVLGAAFAGALTGILFFLLSVFGFAEYGLFVFLATPFVMGVVSGLSLGLTRPRELYRWRSYLTAGLLGLVFCAAGLLGLAYEGALCLAMATPIAVPSNLLGAWMGRSMAEPRRRPSPLPLVLIAAPLVLGADVAINRFPVRPLVSTVEIDAPLETVWRHVVQFDPVPAPRETMFRVGIAHPVGARIDGEGIDAVRYCDFSTGSFVEPITAWEPPYRLAFDVVSQPNPMHEWSPYEDINAPHLAHGLKSHRGEFLLSDLPGGRTLLRGTTWYEVRMGPHGYWRAWSDRFVRGIHLRVLRHIKQLAEAEAGTV